MTLEEYTSYDGLGLAKLVAQKDAASYEEGKRYTVVDLLAALAHQNTVSRQVGTFFETVDLLLTPTTAQIARPLGELNQNRAGNDPDRMDPSGLFILSVHAGVQHHRPAGDQRASALHKIWRSCRGTVCWSHGRRSDAASVCCSAGTGSPLEKQTAESPCRVRGRLKV